MSQGSVELSYNGKRFARHSDLLNYANGEYEGQPDSYWLEIARKFIEEERRAAA